MKINKRILFLSLLLGLVVGLSDTLLDYTFFYSHENFLDLLIFDVPRHEIYIRAVILLCFIFFGLITGDVISRLHQSNERYQRLADNAVDMIYRMSLPDGRYEYVNEAALEITGYTPEEFYKSPALIQQIIHPDWQEYFAGQWKQLLAGENPRHYEFQINHKSGGTRWLNQRSVLVKDDSGKPVAIEGLVTDVTEQNNMAIERETLIAELRKALTEIKALRNIIPICSYCEEIRDDEGYWSNVKSYLTRQAGATFSHGICPDCAKKHFPDLIDRDIFKKSIREPEERLGEEGHPPWGDSDQIYEKLMSECGFLKICPFFKNQLQNMPELAEMMKKIYCRWNFTKCARYQVAITLGKGKVPTDLFPGDAEDAEKLLQE